jgi:hypothetical protein
MKRILQFKINPRNYLLFVVCGILDWFQDSERFCTFADMQRNTLWTEKSSTNFLFVVVQYLISRVRKIHALQTCKEYLGLKINPIFFHLKFCYLISRGRKICAYFCNLLLCNTWFQDSERFCALQIYKEYLALKINPRIFLIVCFAIWLQDSEHLWKEILKLKIKPRNNSFVAPYLISRLRRFVLCRYAKEYLDLKLIPRSTKNQFQVLYENIIRFQFLFQFKCY